MQLLKLILLIFLMFPLITVLTGWGNSFVGAQEEADVAEGEEDDDDDDEGVVEDDLGAGETADAILKSGEAKEDEDDIKTLKPSPYAETTLHFIQPIQQNDFPAGHEARVLVGLRNTGEKDLIIEGMDASLRYPQDFSFYIQNFTSLRYQQTIESMHEATFYYQFTPSDSLSSRSFGLVITLYYKDSDNELFQDSIFNSTINIIEPEEGLDGETFFLYLFLGALVILMAIGAYHFMSSFKKKHMTSSKAKNMVETGTQNNKSDVDYDWLPKNVLQDLNRSPHTKSSTRMRANRKVASTSSGSDD